LWEERHGILSWTVGAVYGGLKAAENFANAFSESALARKYAKAAEDVKLGAERHLLQEDMNCFARMINRKSDGSWVVDKTIDASLVGLWQFGMYAPDDPKIIGTMQMIRDRLWVKTEVGGVARYENDRYHQVSQDITNVPGNPWFITTLWLAEWYARTAKNPDDLNTSLELLEWVAKRALPSGVLAEQVNPYMNAPLSVSPLTWSHAVYVATVQAYLDSLMRLKNGQGKFAGIASDRLDDVL
jgi:GH15 family glucan-1,4-alpha-glucosidase